MRLGQDMKVETDAVLVHVWWCFCVIFSSNVL